jgi:hypothetical protein
MRKIPNSKHGPGLGHSGLCVVDWFWILAALSRRRSGSSFGKRFQDGHKKAQKETKAMDLFVLFCAFLWQFHSFAIASRISGLCLNDVA